MAYILQVDFPFEGPFGEGLASEFRGLAESITNEKGFLWKIWTENPETKEAGGIYVFETKEDAENYLTMHTDRLNGFGIAPIRSRIFQINEPLTAVTRGRVE